MMLCTWTLLQVVFYSSSLVRAIVCWMAASQTSHPLIWSEVEFSIGTGKSNNVCTL